MLKILFSSWETGACRLRKAARLRRLYNGGIEIQFHFSTVFFFSGPSVPLSDATASLIAAIEQEQIGPTENLTRFQNPSNVFPKPHLILEVPNSPLFVVILSHLGLLLSALVVLFWLLQCMSGAG